MEPWLTVHDLLLSRTLDEVDKRMNAVNEQRELANEVAEALANPVAFGLDFDDVSQSVSLSSI